jgi:hypothetical protein
MVVINNQRSYKRYPSGYFNPILLLLYIHNG